MESKVNPILKLDGGGHIVEGGGPILKWDAGELSAICTVVVAQSQATGGGATHLVLAAGVSNRVSNPNAPNEWTPPPDESWTAQATVPHGHPPLNAGAAVARAHAIIEEVGGVLEDYSWEVHVVLEF